MPNEFRITNTHAYAENLDCKPGSLRFKDKTFFGVWDMEPDTAISGVTSVLSIQLSEVKEKVNY